ncbi:MAG: GNAT family N-acetyltransferase [Gemmatimonadaceae bacterium]
MTSSAVELGFRPAELADVHELVDLVNSCYRGDSSRLGWTTEADLLDGPRTDPAELETFIKRPGSVLLLCTSGQEIIGSVRLESQDSTCYLGMLVVKPTLQGVGTGRRLLEAAEDYARSTWGSGTMWMSVFSVRSELIAYYERRGYHETGRTLPFIGDDVHGMPKVRGLHFDVLEKPLL